MVQANPKQEAAKPGGKFNVADIIVGVLLFFGLPLVTLMVIKSYQEPPAPPATEGGAPPSPVVPMGLAEIDERITELDRLYRNNALLFFRRQGDPSLKSEYRIEEAQWARTVLERCRKGFKETLEGAKAHPPTPENLARRATLENWINRVEDNLNDPNLPASTAPRPAPPPPSASPAVPPAPGTEPAPAATAGGASGAATGAAK